ncbi:MAG TPA: toxin-antitoxin system HicB family antitoxin [Pyrinomonadaceae bacterium]|nr:toxin-antitoxin system HicB family antitoxin [Pyrinomonadaceae bacterium]
MNENRYPFNIVWSEEDEEFVATCPAFPGLSALGETEEEALAEAKVALRLFIETCKEKGIPLPEPQTVQAYSGQFRLRTPKSLHRKLAQQAEAEEVSLNSLCVSYLSEAVGVKAEVRRQKDRRERYKNFTQDAPAHHLILQTQKTVMTSTSLYGQDADLAQVPQAVSPLIHEKGH